MINIKNKSIKKDNKEISQKPGFLKVSGDKVFATLQGEGLFETEGGTAGCPAVFLRLQFCNLSCGKKNGWKCDTGYTWDTNREEYYKEPEDWSIDITIKRIKKAWQEKFGDIDLKKRRVVITGGEPLLQQNLIIELIKKMPEWTFELETNGTIIPKNELLNCQINCSPKLENSGNEKKLRYKPEVLKIINNWPISWFKFVVDNQSDFEEIKTISTECSLKSKKILIMPEGYTLEAVNKNLEKIKNVVVNLGWKISNRNQLLWFGSKRRT